MSDIIDTAGNCDCHVETIGLVQWKVIVTRLGFGTSKKQISTQYTSLRKMQRFNDLGNYILWRSVKGGILCVLRSRCRNSSFIRGSGWPCKVHMYIGITLYVCVEGYM